VDFSLDETQQAVADLAADVLGKQVEPDEVWSSMAGAGLLGLALPERCGGDGLGPLAVALVLTEVGRHAAVVPALATLALGVLPVVATGTAAQQENLLPLVADGSRTLTAATNEPGDPLTTTPKTVAHLDDGDWVVSGTKVGVPYAESAHRILVPATLAGGGGGVLLVDPRADGVGLDPVRTSGTAPEYRVRLAGVRVPRADLLGESTEKTESGENTESTDGSAVRRLSAFAVAGACALGDGLLAGALDLTARHVGAREQFGRPLAAFQAVATQVADVYVAARTLHLVARSACWRLDTGRPATADLEVASYWLAEELLPAVHTCQHLHGGLGVDVTYPMHRYYAQARDLTRFVGGAQARLEKWGATACSSN
jgi:3-oxo-4-pregnene-20-carboxyl-CoA dehydrogenase alpha subunit